MIELTVMISGDERKVPFEVFDIDSSPDDIFKMLDLMIKNPGKFKLIISGSVEWEQKQSEYYINYVKTILKHLPEDNRIKNDILFGMILSIMSHGN